MPKPIHIFRSPFTERFYATRAYKVIDAEKGLYEVTGQKDDVTEQVQEIIAKAHAEGHKAGQETMRERAARLVFPFDDTFGHAEDIKTKAKADRIRALPIEEPQR